MLAVRGGVSKLSHRPNDVVSIRSCVSGHEGEFEYSSFHDPSGRVIQYMTTQNPADFERTVRIAGRSFEFPGITVMWGRVDLRGADHWGPFHVRIVRVEYIEIIILALILPLLWMSRRIVKRVLRHRRDVCHRCGYNLTGNTSGVCPECGKPILKNSENSN